ncbi:MAG: T9SS type A sorting domain-containing protein [Bacteroidota bacterium]|nr:T9SS type A sorting domain-containing protein [Bacteroidota bacterium]
MKLNSDGQLQWVETYNGLGDFADHAEAMTIDDRENIYVTGISTQDQKIFGGNSDIVTIKYTQTSTGVVSNNIATGYSLSQNYPNPFNPSTNIAYSIPKSGLVNIKIFDITGKEIAVLVNELKSAGEYSANFNASALSSGTYFYRLESGDFKKTKRMMLIK